MANLISVSHPVFFLLIVLYILVVLTAATGSVIIVTTIVRAKSQMVQKNSLMLNLAVSDLCLVVLGCPATLVQVCFPAWPLPDVSVLCQVLHFLPLLFTFSSTFSVCLIALDR